jgi:hypothetical protein
MHKPESFFFAVAADAEQFTGGVPGQLQNANETSGEKSKKGKKQKLNEMQNQPSKRSDRGKSCESSGAVEVGHTVSTRVVIFMTLFNGFTVEGEFMAS